MHQKPLMPKQGQQIELITTIYQRFVWTIPSAHWSRPL